MTELRIVSVVCTGNICRSPLGQALLEKHLRANGVQDVDVRSFGTWARDGHPPLGEARRAAEALGADLSRHVSTPLDEATLMDSEVVLCAATEHREFILERWPEIDPAKVRLFNEAIEGEAPVDVDDPYGWDAPLFLLVARVIDGAMQAWAERLAHNEVT